MGASAATAREVAVDVLTKVRTEAAYANRVLSAALTRNRLSPPDRRLTTELVYGVLRHQRWLDHALSRHTHRPLAGLRPDVRDVLRLAAYQCLFLQRVPAHAAVNEAVALIGARRGKKVAGFANAVLRKLRCDDLHTDLPQAPLARLALTASFPDEVIDLWHSQLGANEVHQLATAYNEAPPLTLRVNPQKTTVAALIARLEAQGATAVRATAAPLALHVTGLSDPFRTALYRDGFFTVQGEASQLVAAFVDPQPGETIVDLCAGVGGKATDLATRLAGTGRLVALDIHLSKLLRLAEHNKRLGLSGELIVGDMAQTICLGDLQADRILVDAPCSALGLIGRHPELRWRRPLHTEDALVALQRRLLRRAVTLLKPGGVLVYSVCTTSDAEGPGQAAWLQQTFPQLEPLPPVHAPLTRFAAQEQIRLWPHRHGTDGFFMARYKRCISTRA